jgi:hypothetical protein
LKEILGKPEGYNLKRIFGGKTVRDCGNLVFQSLFYVESSTGRQFITSPFKNRDLKASETSETADTVQSRIASYKNEPDSELKQ